MRKLLTSVILASFIAAPAQARDWRDQPTDVQPGAFIGARIKMPLGGGNHNAKAQAAFAIAPTQSRISGDGMIRTRIGEGIALSLSPGEKPWLTLAGVRADAALGLQRQGHVKADHKLGLSSGGWIAVGVGVALLAGAAALYIAATDCPDHADECG